MKVLFTGIGGFGSWTMRAEQIAATRPDWKAVPHATRKDAEGMDVVVIVKSIRKESLAELKLWGGPLVYDALDFWRQSRNPLKRWLRKKYRLRTVDDARTMAAPYFARIDPDLILCPTRAMVEDITPLGWKAGLHYHHYDPRMGDILTPSGKRRVVYHGRREHLGWWSVAAHVSCIIHGAEFVVSNGPQPAPGHVLLGMRRGYPWISRRWKSNIKAAVALRTGLPFVAWPEAGYRETHPSAFWFTSVFEMHRAIGQALKAEPKARDDRFSVEACANELEKVLRDLIENRAEQPTTATATPDR